LFIDNFQNFFIGDKVSIKNKFFIGRRRVNKKIADFVIRNNNVFTIDNIYDDNFIVMIGFKEINESVEFDQVIHG
jgi:hypothetical protein